MVDNADSGGSSHDPQHLSAQADPQVTKTTPTLPQTQKQPLIEAASSATGERRVKPTSSCDQNDQAQKKDTEAALRQQKEYVENYRIEKKLYNPVADLPRLHPEPDYIIKTRPPMWDDWRLNIFRGIKENRLKMEANKIARRKCWETGGAFEKCSAQSGMWMTSFRCKNEFNNFINCCYHEQHVELDKLRRDTKAHDEWYWLNLYDEDGEIGKQAAWEPESSLTGIWGTFLYNMFYKAAHQGVKDDGKKETWQDRNKRLEYLRKKQGEDIDALKSEWELDFHLDEKKAMELNGVIDKNIYNV